jgi:hypothetical protein
MKIIFSNEEAQQHFYSAMCNGLGYITGYDLELKFNRETYKETSAKMSGGDFGVCHEDVLLQMLKDGHKIALYDWNDDIVNTISIQDVYDRMPLVDARHLLDMVNERDDADTADAILQTVFLGEVVYG